MILLIDAFNVIYKFPELEEHMYRGNLPEARQGLLNILQRLYRKLKTNPEIHLFIDGKKNRGDETDREKVGPIRVYYSQDLSADHMIKEYINSTPSPGEIRVVSSDKDILYHAKKHKCQIQTSEEFARWVQETFTALKTEPEKDSDPRLTGEELRFWQQMFAKRKKEK